MTPRRMFFVFSAVVAVAFASAALVLPVALWFLAPLVALVTIGLHDCFQTRHSILRLYPVLGHGRFLAERIRPEIQQYFVESDMNGTPFSRETRQVVYQRAKGQQDKMPFGTQLNVYAPGYEFLAHSMYPKVASGEQPRVTIGGPHCTQPYSASMLNVSAMSFGALSGAAVTALSRGAKAGGFAHNTGEGGVSPYHLAGGADLIWQIGTGYFGCRTESGAFDPTMFTEQVSHPSIKAIEVKISQGAKPGHGGILPGPKVTPEIAAIRKVTVGKDVISPPSHSAFHSPLELLQFIALLRNLSGGKPVGFKLCIGRTEEFVAVVDAMAHSGITPDFITVDGAEGGTGAAPPELSDSVGMPMREGLNFVHTTLVEYGQRDHIKLICAGKVATGFDMVRSFALGADLCYSARAMMLSLGCIQALRCHTNHCPVGIATQDPHRAKALVVSDKAQRVSHFHHETVASFLELTAAAGCNQPSELGLDHVHRRLNESSVASYREIFGTPVELTRRPSVGGETSARPQSAHRHKELTQ